MYSWTTWVIIITCIIFVKTKRKKLTVKISIVLQEMFLSRAVGGDCLVQTVLLTCQMVWNRIWLLGPQFLHLYEEEVDPIVSRAVQP